MPTFWEICLRLLLAFAAGFLIGDWYSNLTVKTTLEAITESILRQRLEALGPTVLAMRTTWDREQRFKTIACELKLKRRRRFELASGVLADLAQYPGILRIEWT